MTPNEQALPVQAIIEAAHQVFHNAMTAAFKDETGNPDHAGVDAVVRFMLAHTHPAVSDGAGEVAHNLGVIAPGDTWLDKDAQYYTSTIDVGGHYSRIYCFGSGEAGANQLRDIVIAALSQLASGGVAREKVLREALETARDYVSDVADGSSIYVFTAKAANEQMRETARKDLTRIDAALAAPGQDEG